MIARRKPLPRLRTPIARKPVKKRNVKRRASEFKRCYGSKQRVAFIRGLACSACGVVGYSENAHLLGNGGMGRKAGYETIGPLCGPKPYGDTGGFDLDCSIGAGCHEYYDEQRSGFNRFFPDFDPAKVARETEEMWQAHSGPRDKP